MMRAIILCLTVALPLCSVLAQLQDPAFPWLSNESMSNSFAQAIKSAAPSALPAGDKSVLGTKRLSLHINPDPRVHGPLPSWCRPAAERTAGPWHSLSDDEYTNESPYLLCGLPGKTSRSTQAQRASHRRAAHGQTQGIYTKASVHGQ